MAQHFYSFGYIQRQENYLPYRYIADFPWITSGTEPAYEPIDCQTLEQGMFKRMEKIELTHTRWFRMAGNLASDMCYETGTFIPELTPYHLDTLRQKRELYFQSMGETVSNVPRCTKDCVIHCDCHSWYGIVLTDSGTKVDTERSPLPKTSYVYCVDCRDLCVDCRDLCVDCRDLAKRNSLARFNPDSGIPLRNSTCPECKGRPQRRKVHTLLEGYWFC